MNRKAVIQSISAHYQMTEATSSLSLSNRTDWIMMITDRSRRFSVYLLHFWFLLTFQSRSRATSDTIKLTMILWDQCWAPISFLSLNVSRIQQFIYTATYCFYKNIHGLSPEKFTVIVFRSEDTTCFMYNIMYPAHYAHSNYV